MKKSKPTQSTTELLRSEGFKVTTARLALLNVLISKHIPLTVEDITEAMTTGSNPTTVYRALGQFVQAGIVQQTHFRDGKTYYEFQSHHHHHIVCTACGVKEEVSLCVESSLSRIVKESKKFNHIQDHILEFFGVCYNCTTV